MRTNGISTYGRIAVLTVLLGGLCTLAFAQLGTLAESNGVVRAWGDNWNGQLNVPGGVFSAVSGGGAHSLGIRADGTLAGWG